MLITEVAEYIMVWAVENSGFKLEPLTPRPRVERGIRGDTHGSWTFPGSFNIAIYCGPIRPVIRLTLEELQTMLDLLGPVETWNLILEERGMPAATFNFERLR